MTYLESNLIIPYYHGKGGERFTFVNGSAGISYLTAGFNSGGGTIAGFNASITTSGFYDLTRYHLIEIDANVSLTAATFSVKIIDESIIETVLTTTAINGKVYLDISTYTGMYTLKFAATTTSDWAHKIASIQVHEIKLLQI